jgi:hypothetical protein
MRKLMVVHVGWIMIIIKGDTDASILHGVKIVQKK